MNYSDTKIEVRIKPTYIIVSLLLALFTFGIGGLVMWLMTITWPRSLDQEGITLRSGKRVLWKNATRAQPTRVVFLGMRVNGGLILHFGNDMVSVVPASITPADQVVELVARKTGARPG